MDLEITPEPTEEERTAIDAALAQDAADSRSSPWNPLVLPGSDPEA